MIVTLSNSYIEKHGDGYSIFISIPDDSRNFLHCDPLRLDRMLMYYQDIIAQKIGNYNCSIVEDGTYFRIKTQLRCGEQLNGDNDTDLIFHSRKLNLNDAVFEYGLLIGLPEKQLVKTK
ncbi:MAG: hypothetical protein K5790_10310 [Nitrosopumilus sp.]|uniref:hypothetical protein n=1 Tax=Nitrosopumilus sp. TaxID=2024843 RepID=UPI00247F0533|nr:hypothetical protein [Nitrosopumilus sp.]MCV0393662.1 hypothetical protein [Nitrosopumilus sp.]